MSEKILLFKVQLFVLHFVQHGPLITWFSVIVLFFQRPYLRFSFIRSSKIGPQLISISATCSYSFLIFEFCYVVTTLFFLLYFWSNTFFCRCYQPVLSKLILNGTCRQSKYAVRCLHEMSKDSHQIMERVFKVDYIF